MTLILFSAGAVAFAFACKRPIKSCPLAFYALAATLDVLFVVGSFAGLPPMLYDALFLLLHKCTLATALFAVVMYIGVFARDSRVATYLRPIRAELSIMAWLLSLGHMAIYLSSYAANLSTGLPQTNVAVALALALALFALLVVLGVTSFNVVEEAHEEGDVEARAAAGVSLLRASCTCICCSCWCPPPCAAALLRRWPSPCTRWCS